MTKKFHFILHVTLIHRFEFHQHFRVWLWHKCNYYNHWSFIWCLDSPICKFLESINLYSNYIFSDVFQVPLTYRVLLGTSGMEKHRGRQKILVFSYYRSSRLLMYVKTGVLEIFLIFTGKLLCWSLFLIGLQSFQACNITKKRLQTAVFL